MSTCTTQTCNVCPPSPIPPWHRPTVQPVTHSLVEDGTISLNTNLTYLNQTTPKDAGDESVPYVAVLPNGNYKQQRKTIVIPAESVAETSIWSVTGTFVGFTSLTFNDLGTSVELMWDGNGWQYIGGNAIKEI